MELVERDNLERYVTRLLIALGFSPRHFGFSYMREMIIVCVKSSNQKLAYLYSHVAFKYNMPTDAVQTAIRTALKTAQEQTCFLKIESLIGVKFIERNYFLSPREFLAIMQEFLLYVWDGKNELL